MSALFPKFTHRTFHTMVIFFSFFKYSCDIVTIGIYDSPSSNIPTLNVGRTFMIFPTWASAHFDAFRCYFICLEK